MAGTRKGVDLKFLIFLLIIILSACDTPSARNNFGVSVYHDGDSASAIQAFQRAAVIIPDEAVPYANLGIALAENGALERARQALDYALSKANNNSSLIAQIHYNLGNIQYLERKYMEAIAEYQKALLLNPDDHAARYNLELAYRRLSLPAESGAESPGPSDESQSNEIGSTPVITPTPEASSPSGTLSAADAENLLDAVQRGQQMFPTQASVSIPNSSGKDW